jgi:signal transduction histidine kinase
MLDLKRNRIAVCKTESERPLLIGIITLNDSLVESCRDCFESLPAPGYQVEQHRSSDIEGHCDIYVWDRESIGRVPTALTEHNSSVKIVVINKTSLSSLRRELGHDDFDHVRNPISGRSLKAAFSRALSRVLFARLDRDEIVQQPFEANRSIQEYQEDRNNFVERVTHDVCVPLTAVQGYCGLLLAGQLGTLNADQVQVLERMKRGLAKLWKSVEALDGLGQPTQMSTRLKLKNSTFEECLQQAVDEVVPMLESKQITIKLEIEPATGRFWLDSQKIQQVVFNLLNNSCKVSPCGSSITVRGHQDSSTAYQVDIVDSGFEVADSDIETIFDEHAPCNHSRDRAGAGLGLAICRTIVEAHNGKIWASSNSEGTTFSLLLPTADAGQESHLSRMAV